MGKAAPVDGLVDVVRRHVAANFGPQVVREMLRMHDAGKLSAARFVEAQRSMLAERDAVDTMGRRIGGRRKGGAQ